MSYYSNTLLSLFSQVEAAVELEDEKILQEILDSIDTYSRNQVTSNIDLTYIVRKSPIMASILIDYGTNINQIIKSTKLNQQQDRAEEIYYPLLGYAIENKLFKLTDTLMTHPALELNQTVIYTVVHLVNNIVTEQSVPLLLYIAQRNKELALSLMDKSDIDINRYIISIEIGSCHTKTEHYVPLIAYASEHKQQELAFLLLNREDIDINRYVITINTNANGAKVEEHIPLIAYIAQVDNKLTTSLLNDSRLNLSFPILRVTNTDNSKEVIVEEDSLLDYSKKNNLHTLLAYYKVEEIVDNKYEELCD